MEKTKIIKIILVLLAVLFNVINAQIANKITEREIKLSGNYFWGEGIRDTLKEAKQDAILDLQYKISVTLRATSESKVSENSEGVNSSFNKNIKMFSTIKLKRLEFFQKERSDGKYLVDAYISKENYKKLINEIKNDVTDRVKLAETMEREKGIVRAIPTYYLAYLNTFYSPDPIPYKSVTYKQDYSNVRFFLETKIRSYLAELEIKQDSITIDPATKELITVNLDVNYLKLNVDNVEISFNIPGNPKQRVEQGKAKLFLYSQPSAIKDEYEVNLSVNFNNSSDLAEFNKEFGITEKQKVVLDFTKLVKFDFKVKPLDGGAIQFEPVVENLSVSSILWDFGNGVTSNDLKSIYTFVEDSIHKVSLTVNGLDEMKVVKYIDASGKIVEEIDYNSNTNDKKTNPILEALSKRKTFDTVIEELIKYKKEGKLIFSVKSKDFVDISLCYGMIVDPSTRKILSIISPGKNKRVNILNGKTVPDYRIKYKGKGIIWFQLN